MVGHRWYDAEVGRFLTRDPAKSGRNWYSYCGNNPVGCVDPEGLQFVNPFDDWVAGWNRTIGNFQRDLQIAITGRIEHDDNGNTVQVGGATMLPNPSGNAMTYDDVIHVPDERTYDRYMRNPHWRDHEDGHIKQGFKSWMFPCYALAWLSGVIDQWADGGQSHGGPYGHDYNIFEMGAEDYANRQGR